MKFTIHYIERVDSTNKYAFALCKRGEANEGEVFVAKEQYKGRGYQNNIWLSDPGKNLTFSLVIQPHFVLPAQQFAITQFISLAILDQLKKLLPDEIIKIKWPNDVYINEKKVCGVLVQNTITGNTFDYAIIGVGLNVHQKDFPVELPNPTSLIYYLKSELNLREFLNDLLSSVNRRYEQLIFSPELLKEAYLQHLYRFKKMSEFEDANGKFLGEIKGIGDFGELLITDDTGHLRKYNFKEIEFAN